MTKYWGMEEAIAELGLDITPSRMRQVCSRLRERGFIVYDVQDRHYLTANRRRKLSLRNLEVLTLYFHYVEEGIITLAGEGRHWKDKWPGEMMKHVMLTGWPLYKPVTHEIGDMQMILVPRSEVLDGWRAEQE